MKDNKNNISMNLNLLSEKSAFEKLEENLKHAIFGVLYVLLKNQTFSIWMEIIFVFIQLFQLLSFPFNLAIFKNVWKKEETFTQISKFLRYFNLVVFFQDNEEMFLLTFYFCVCLIALVFINIIYVSIAFSRNKLNVVWPLKVLRSIISFLVTILFLPILEMLLSVLNCKDYTDPATNTTIKVNAYAQSMQCWSGPYYIHAIFSIFKSIFFIIICLIVQMTYFETKSSTENVSAKANSTSDVLMLVSKIIILISFTFFGDTDNQWILIAILFFLSAFTFYTYFEGMPYYNMKVMKVYLIATASFLWCNICLLVGKILETSGFDGCLPMFLVGIPLIVSIIITLSNREITLLFTNLNKFENGEKVQKQIRFYLDLVDKKDKDRNSFTILKGYIAIYEESCTLQDCALKKYNYNLTQNKLDTVAFLLQHAEALYQNGISKFPNCTSLRISYAFFLLERLKKKQQANLELTNAEKYSPKFDEQFIVYRYKKLIEENSSEGGEHDENLDVVSNIAYKNHFTQFKNCISKAATLYMDFWSLLINPNQDNAEDLAKLNDCGSKINHIVEEINIHFEKMQKLRHNDQEVIRYYADFLNDILNDKEKASSYKSRLNEIDNGKQSQDDLNLLNNDVNALSTSDEYQFVIISAQIEKLGIIQNLSLGICSLLGYTRAELVGKNVEMIMPEVYHKYHKTILLNKLNEWKKNNLIAQQQSKTYKPSWKDVNGFGKNKSRYLIPTFFKVAYLPNEEQNESIFIAKMATENFDSATSNQTQSCFVLVSSNFIIQNFTANSVSALGLNSNSINNVTMEIIKFIKEFQDEYYKCDLDEKTHEQIISLKRNILMTRFRDRVPITWRMSDLNKNKTNLSELKDNKSEASRDNNNTSNTRSISGNRSMVGRTNIEAHFKLSVTDMYIFGRNEGYIFRFDYNTNDPNSSKNFNASNLKSEIVNNPSNNFNNNVPQNMPESSNKFRKELSSTIINNQGESEVNLKIDKGFIPNATNVFLLDTKKMSYVMNPKNPGEIKEAIKVDAIKKITKEPTKKDDSEISDSSDLSDSQSYSASAENSQDLGELGASPSNKSLGNPTAKKRGNEEYYTVNLYQVKLLQYDFQKESIIEIPDGNKISQVEAKKTEDHRKKDPDMANTSQSKLANADSAEDPDEDLEDISIKEGILIKQIEYALSKEENQPTITRMKYISFFIFVSLIGLAAIFLALFLISKSVLGENINLVYNTFTLVYNTIYGLFHTRELILLNNPKYLNFHQPRVEYIKNNTDSLLSLFSSSHTLLTSIITTSLPISASNFELLYNTNISTFILEDDLNIKSIKLKLSSAIIETNTALYHIAHQDVGEIYPTSKDVFYFMYNSINNIYNMLFRQSQIFIEELGLNVKNYQMVFLYIFASVVGFCVISYFLITYAYMAVGKRKESYLEVFFEIGEGVIRNSLEKCEKFTKKFQSDNISEEVSNLDEAEIINDTNSSLLANVRSSRNPSKKRKSNNSKEDKIIKIKILIGLLFISLFFFVMYFVYQSYLEIIKTYVEIYNNNCNEQAYFLVVFNVLREYFFDRNTDVFGEKVNSYMYKTIDEMYKFKLERENFTYLNKENFPSDYNTLYDEVMNNNICSYAGDIFDTYLTKLNLNCSSFVANSSSYGLNILLTNYIEEIRASKFKFDLILEDLLSNKNNRIYNNTLFGSKSDSVRAPFNNNSFNNPNQTSSLIINTLRMLESNISLNKSNADSISIAANNSNPDLNTNAYDPFNIFNENSVRNLGLVNRFMIRPAYEALKLKLETSITDNLDTFKLIYIVILSVFISGLLFVYLFLWRPFENGLNATIYKTKNMLSIIPKEVLANLTNIHKLLDIGQNLSKNNKKAKKSPPSANAQKTTEAANAKELNNTAINAKSA